MSYYKDSNEAAMMIGSYRQQESHGLLSRSQDGGFMISGRFSVPKQYHSNQNRNNNNQLSVPPPLDATPISMSFQSRAAVIPCEDEVEIQDMPASDEEDIEAEQAALGVPDRNLSTQQFDFETDFASPDAVEPPAGVVPSPDPVLPETTPEEQHKVTVDDFKLLAVVGR